jgi:hypothetical protein
MDDNWKKEIENLLEENEFWLNCIRHVELDYTLEQQNRELCIELIKWHELSKETYTLLEGIYEEVNATSCQIDKDHIISLFDNTFKKVKSNYYNNIEGKKNPHYRP